MKTNEETGKNLRNNGSKYTVIKDRDTFLLKNIYIKKKRLVYAFIGGMWYSRNKFSLEQNISLPYPFSTYYTTKILDRRSDGEIVRSLYYVKMPLIALQFKDECISIEFDPIIKINNQEIIPFISLKEDEDSYIVSFYIFKSFEIKEKERAWLGIGRKKKISVELKPGDSFEFHIEVKKYNDWKDAVKTFVKKNITEEVDTTIAKEVFDRGVKSLFRSYDDIHGTFIQLPWRKTTGFTFVDSSYSLLSYEAVRLHYFMMLYNRTRNKQFLEWSLKLRRLFTNQRLYKKNLRTGEGLVWYNMTNLSRKGLEGFFYMDCGYGGYPGGQGTIAFHLLNYMQYREDEEIEDLVKESLRYIMSTQKENGSWPVAIHQEGIMRFRPENLRRYETHGGTAEAVRALLAGYRRFKDASMLNSGKRGLDYLKEDYPICYNGLRDIGLNEAEAFSAVSSIEAFLDGYKITKDRSYLDYAVKYAYYTLTWFYFYNTDKLKLKFNFHPISRSITPRLSPYETVWIVSTYLRLSEFTDDDMWRRMAKLAYNEVVEWISESGGLCEGIFPKLLEELKPLPMEQTFATTELIRASSKFLENSNRNNNTKRLDFGDRDGIRIEKKKNRIVIYYSKKRLLEFDVKNFMVVFIKGAKLNRYGISISFYNPYSLKGILKMRIKNIFRGRHGKFILGLKSIKYIFNGVHPPRKLEEPKMDLLGNHMKKFYITIEDDHADVRYETDIHKVEIHITVTKKEDSILVMFDPFVIKVLNHGLECKQVLFPVVGSKLRKKDKNLLEFHGFDIITDYKQIIEGDDFLAIDRTLETNWTHGGIYKGIVFNR